MDILIRMGMAMPMDILTATFSRMEQLRQMETPTEQLKRLMGAPTVMATQSPRKMDTIKNLRRNYWFGLQQTRRLSSV